ncbi:Heterokaryon incompatibility protein [Rutstroemia sp. NJR-2017a BVV2]|nr:Heterokaryon incompatibility protein [Rutstroemia sp. NJR-2017a BVV2]PQE23296.1 Heterokaryon incompatibility protein [Rutstroemia sp. NJR-2017a BVV2]
MAVVSSFKYSPLEKGSIRLLRVLPESTAEDIRCQLIYMQLEAKSISSFAALSYCWYDPTPVATITVNDQALGIAQNLLDFLQNRFIYSKRMLSHDSETLKKNDLWIDAICINQADDQEKSEQVQQMWKIYTMAPLVIAWLGKEKEFTKKAFFALNTRYVGKMTGKAPPEAFEKMIEEAREDIGKLSEDPYFTRTWITPEVICSADRMMLHSGRHVTYLDSLYDFTALSKGTIGTQGSLRARGKNGLTLAVEGLIYTLRRSREIVKAAMANKMQMSEGINTLIACIMDNKTKECSDVRDKIFAFRGLPLAQLFDSKETPLLEVDYSMTLDEVAVATLSYIDKLDCMDNTRGGAYSQYAPFVVIGLFRVDIAAQEFREWVESRLQRNEEHGTVHFITRSCKKIDCSTRFFDRLLGNGVSDLTRILCCRFEDTDPSDIQKRFEQAKEKDRKQFSIFPLP